MAGLLDTEELDVVRSALPLYPPHPFIVDAETEPWVESVSVRAKLGKRQEGLTLEKEAGKFDADVAVPLGHASALDIVWDRHGPKLLDPLEDAVSASETDNDFGDAEKEGLDPVLHEFSIKGKLVIVAVHLSARLELHPVDGGARSLGFCVPDCAEVS